jgi:hypothetical protein
MRRVAPHRHYPGKVGIPDWVRDLIPHDTPSCNARTLRQAIFAARSSLMLDFMMLALAAIFFAAGIGYAYACERL